MTARGFAPAAIPQNRSLMAEIGGIVVIVSRLGTHPNFRRNQSRVYQRRAVQCARLGSESLVSLRFSLPRTYKIRLHWQSLAHLSLPFKNLGLPAVISTNAGQFRSEERR